MIRLGRVKTNQAKSQDLYLSVQVIQLSFYAISFRILVKLS